MKYLLCILQLLLSFAIANAQDTLDLKYCQETAISQSPIQQQELLQESITLLKVKTLKNTYYPQLQVSGQAIYLSEVFTLPFPDFPGIQLPDIPKDQYKFTLNLSQKIYDGGYTRYSKMVERQQLDANKQKIEVNLFQIKEVINQLYFGAALLQENEKLLKTVLEELNNRMKVMESLVKNGVVLKSAKDGLQKEVLKKEQLVLEVQLDRHSLLEMLSEWIGEPVSDSVVLQLPVRSSGIDSITLNRPEQQLFALQIASLDLNKKLARVKNRPTIFAFATGGIGRPNPLNIFETGFSPYYTVGVQLDWNILNWGNSSRQRRILDLNQQIIQTEQQDFEKKLNTSLIKDRGEITKLEQLIEKDKEIIDLQEKMVKQAQSQLENGVINSTDYVSELNAKTQAELDLQLHQIKLVQAEINLLTRSGNF